MPLVAGPSPGRKNRHRSARSAPRAVLHQGMFAAANRRFLHLLGYRAFEELQSIPFLDLIPPICRQGVKDWLLRAEKDSSPETAPQISLRTSDGEVIAVIAQYENLKFNNEDCIQLILSPVHAPGPDPVVQLDLQDSFVSLPSTCADSGRDSHGHRGRVTDARSSRVPNVPSTRAPARKDAHAGQPRSSDRRVLPLWLSIGILVVLCILPTALLLHLKVNNAPKVYFPDNAPAVIADEALHETFPSDQNIVLLFEGDHLFSDDFLTRFAELGDRIAASNLVDKVLSVTRQDHITATDDGFSIEKLIDTSNLKATTPAERLARARGDRLANKALVATDGSALAMAVIPYASEDSFQRRALYTSVMNAARAVGLSGHLKAVGGEIAVDVAELHSMLRDNLTFIPTTAIVGLTLIWWMFRRWLSVILSLATITAVNATTLSLYVFAGQPFNLISSIIPPLLTALTIATLIHLFNALRYESRRGFAGAERISRAIRDVHKPILFTTLTTGAGLASLGSSQMVPVAILGFFSAAGVLVAYALTVYVLPSILARGDLSSWPRHPVGLRWFDSFVRFCVRTSAKNPLAVIIGVILLAAAGAEQLPNIYVESNLLQFFRPQDTIRIDTNRIQEKLSGTNSLEVLFESPLSDGLARPDVLRKIRQFQIWTETLPQVDKSFSHADFIVEMNAAIGGGVHATQSIPDDANLISQYLLVYDGNNMYDFVDRNLQVARVHLALNVHGAKETRTVIDKVRTFLRQQKFEPISWDIGGLGRLFSDMERLLVKGQVSSLAGALAMIFLLFLLLLRSFGAAVLCMIPNLAPVLFIFSAMGAFGVWLDMGTVMVASVAVGIAVDDTIHLYHGFIRRRREGVRPVTALSRAYAQAGPAVIATTLILSVQFCTLGLSPFVPTSNFGILTSLGLVIALAFDLTLLPALLSLVYIRPWSIRP